MFIADLPPQMQEQVTCSIQAAHKYEIPVNVLLAISDQEGGKAGQWVENKNGTFDIGTMQFNTTYLKDLEKYGITADSVAVEGCYPYDLAAWRISNHIKNDNGDFWQRVANYHSKTLEHNQTYQAAIIKHAQKWEQWFNDRKQHNNEPPKPYVASLTLGESEKTDTPFTIAPTYAIDNKHDLESKALEASSVVDLNFNHSDIALNQ